MDVRRHLRRPAAFAGDRSWQDLLLQSCGLFYAASVLDGDDFDRRIARAFKVVLADERGHGPANVFKVNKVIRSEQDLEGASEMLRARALQRLRMRNEQFSPPLPAERLEAIMDGDIDLGVVRDIWGDSTYRFVAGAH